MANIFKMQTSSLFFITNCKIFINQYMRNSLKAYDIKSFKFSQIIIRKLKTVKPLNLMSRITQELLRKRSQHNDMCLSTLQQISLHQQELVKIQNLDILCRHLKILYLQNNIIEKMENLNKLKELEYLNLALNNISKIQNIERCESLKKLDMTVNFIDVFDLHESVQCLSKLPSLKQIYLTGNPCEQWKGCKQYVIAHVPTLQVYNGETIAPSQRIQAVQNLSILKADLFQEIQLKKVQIKKQEAEYQQLKQKEKYMTEQQKKHLKTPYTKDSRRQMYYQMAADKQQKQRQKNPEKYEIKKESEMFNREGEIRQCNEGKFKFTLRQFDDADFSFFQLQIPKHIDTNDLIVTLNPEWVSVRVKDKLTQLRLTETIIVSQSKTERSQITGFLIVKMKKLHPQQFLRRNKQIEIKKKKQEEIQKKKTEKQQKQKRLKLCQEYERRMEQIQNQIPDLQ